MRTNRICIYVGGRGTGKTSLMKELIDVFPLPKTLVVDTFDNPAWRTLETHNHPEWKWRVIPAMPVENIKKHKTGLYRVFSSDTDVLQQNVAEYCMNTAVIFEDSTRYFPLNLTKTQKNYLLNSKQTNCDIHLVFHTLSSIPPELLKYADHLIMFKTGEGSYNDKKYYFPTFKEKFQTVLNSQDQYIFEEIRLN